MVPACEEVASASVEAFSCLNGEGVHVQEELDEGVWPEVVRVVCLVEEQRMGEEGHGK